MTFRRAKSEEFERIRDFYWALIDVMEGKEGDPGWRRGIYPSDDELRGALSKGQLYLLEDGDTVAASVIVNHDRNEGYAGLPWRVDAQGDEVVVLHALGVDPAIQGRGVAGRVVDGFMALAREQGAKCVRLDVLSGNRSAERIYRRAGFEFIAAKNMFYEDTGWTEFLMFELEL